MIVGLVEIFGWVVEEWRLCGLVGVLRRCCGRDEKGMGWLMKMS